MCNLSEWGELSNVRMHISKKKQNKWFRTLGKLPSNNKNVDATELCRMKANSSLAYTGHVNVCATENSRTNISCFHRKHFYPSDPKIDFCRIFLVTNLLDDSKYYFCVFLSLLFREMVDIYHRVNGHFLFALHTDKICLIIDHFCSVDYERMNGSESCV